MTTTVCPGDVLGAVGALGAGPGTYEWRGQVRASIVGTRRDLDGVVSVVASDENALLPSVGDTVLCRITKVNPRFATARLLTVGDTPLRGAGFGALIRVQDVRLTELDKVTIYASFRPGDVVRAQVLSLGDKRYFYLSTQRNDLGVVGATCAVSGQQMVAASWETMRCPKSGIVEQRKVAKIAE